MSKHANAWGIGVFFTLVGCGAFAALAPLGCSGDDVQPTPTDSGSSETAADSTSDTQSDSGSGSETADAPSESEVAPEAGTLSARATKGIAISPFALKTDGLTLDQKEQLGVGSYLVNAIGDCNGCHQNAGPGGPPKYLGGGTPFALDASGSVVYARNLTTDATNGLKLTESEFLDALRTGKDHKNVGEALIVMPWPSFRWMGTSDLKAIYAYLKQVPAVANPIPNDIKGAAAAAKPVPFPTSFGDGDVSRALPAETTTDALFSDRGNAIQPLVEPASFAALTAADKTLYGRGSYLVGAVAICSDCHTNPSRSFAPGPSFLKMGTAQFLTGGAVFHVPPGLDALSKTTRTMSANLLGKTHGFTWDLTKFKAAVTEGKFDLGAATRPIAFPMPWQAFKNMVDEDIVAIFTYLKAQKPLEGTVDKETQGPARYCTTSTDCDATAGETCNTATKECIGRTCAKAADCGACQTCTSLKCAAPASSSTCPAAGI